MTTGAFIAFIPPRCHHQLDIMVKGTTTILEIYDACIYKFKNGKQGVGIMHSRKLLGVGYLGSCSNMSFIVPVRINHINTSMDDLVSAVLFKLSLYYKTLYYTPTTKLGEGLLEYPGVSVSKSVCPSVGLSVRLSEGGFWTITQTI